MSNGLKLKVKNICPVGDAKIAFCRWPRWSLTITGARQSGPHPHELHTAVQRGLSAEQKQEVLFLRQQHGGKLDELEDIHIK